MNRVMNAVTGFYSALAQRDAKAIRATLADDFSFRGPMMKFDDPESFANAMAAFPVEATASDSRFVVGGGDVAHVFNWEMTAPAKAKIPMCEVIKVANGKVQRSELFFDTKLFPAGL